MGSQIITVRNRHVLDKTFLAQIVGKPVLEYSTSAGAKAGDNFMGTLLSLNVKTNNEVHHLVIKSVLPMTGAITKDALNDSKLIADSDAYPKEIVYYKQIRPLFQELFQNYKERLSFFEGPKFYPSLHDASSQGLYDYIVLQDLRPNGYKMANKLTGLNYEEMTATIKCLAFIHSGSFYLLNGKGNLCNKLQSIKQDPLSLTNMHGWSKDLIQGFDMELFFDEVVAKVVELIEDGGQKEIAEKIKRISINGHKNILMDLWNKTTDQGKFFRVLVHGDLWTNNILIKYGPDGKAVEDVKFIDYQMNRLGNIYEDLHYFIFCSTTADFRKLHLKSCLQMYYKEFEKVLQDLNCPLPNGFTEEQLHSTFNETLNYGFVYNLLAIPYQLGQFAPGSEQDTQGQQILNVETLEHVEPKTVNPDYQKMFDAAVTDLHNAARNSPIALQRLDEMIKEMIDLGLIN